MKQALTNLLNALAERVRPHGHEWKEYLRTETIEWEDPEWWMDKISKVEVVRVYYQCTKCGKKKVIKA